MPLSLPEELGIGDCLNRAAMTDCAFNHLSQLWLVEPEWARMFCSTLDLRAAESVPRDPDTGSPVFSIQDGVAVIEANGQIMKAFSKLGGTSSIAIRRALRTAVARDDVNAILMIVDSPGGMVAGMEELAADVRRASEAKPLHVHVDDLAGSAAVWMIAQPKIHISANRMADVGSIGVFGVIEDSSKAAEDAGIKVHVIGTGKFKGAGIPGTVITEEQLEDVQKRVNEINRFFIASVAEGRGITTKEVRDIADGRMFGAQEAKKLGLIDSISNMDEAFARVLKRVAPRASRRTRSARASIAIASAEE